MAVQQFGIEVIKQVSKFAFTTTGSLVNIFKDKKVDFGEQLQLLSVVLNGVSLAKAIPQLRQELKELSAAEKKELREYLVSEFGLIQVGAKALDAQIKKTINWAFEGVEVYDGWKTLKK